MQTVVTFKGNSREIIINFKVDEETGELMYNINVDPPLMENGEFNLETHLADIFMGALLDPTVSNAEDTNTEEPVLEDFNPEDPTIEVNIDEL